MAANRGTTTALIAAVPAAALVVVLSIVLFGGQSSAASCNPTGPGITLDPTSLPDVQVANYDHTQLQNATFIVAAGQALGLGVRDQTIGVMTALGESGLRVLDHGDVKGPDSRGLFQQRDNGAWGTLADRMDPTTSATNFFHALMGVDGRDSLDPTIVAHDTQHNADPYYYAQFWNDAVTIVQALAGSDVPLTAGTGDQVCTSLPATSTLAPTARGWVAPGTGPVMSRFGMRSNPGQLDHGQVRLHAGTDLADGGCNSPIYAAHDGVVIDASIDAADGNVGVIAVDHGGGMVTRYLHMYASGILVTVGQHVTAGQQIGRVGSSGNSTGCHLHFEVLINGHPTDPEPYMAGVGITLGS